MCKRTAEHRRGTLHCFKLAAVLAGCACQHQKVSRFVQLFVVGVVGVRYAEALEFYRRQDLKKIRVSGGLSSYFVPIMYRAEMRKWRSKVTELVIAVEAICCIHNQLRCRRSQLLGGCERTLEQKWALRRSVCNHVAMCTCVCSCFIVKVFRYKQERTE